MKFLLSLVILLFSSALFSQDIIIKLDGSEMDVKVAKIGNSEIEYRRKDQGSNGPVYTILKSEIFMIRYSDGTKDVFNPVPSVSNTPKQPSAVVSTPNQTALQQNPQIVETPLAPANTENAFDAKSSTSATPQHFPGQETHNLLNRTYYGYGGSYWAPFGISWFMYFSRGWGAYGNVRFRWVTYYDAYTIENGFGGLNVVENATNDVIDISGYERYESWNPFSRSTFAFGLTKVLNTNPSKSVLPGFYGGLCISRETRYYPYEQPYSSGYYLVRDGVNETLGMELEIGVTLLVRNFHFNTGVSYFNAVRSGDWTFGIGYSY
jgi:hypothetical protein